MIILQYGPAQTNAMHQFAIWTALATKGIGVLHYNTIIPLVDEMTSKEFNILKVGNLLLKCHLVIFIEAAGEKHLIQWKIVS